MFHDATGAPLSSSGASQGGTATGPGASQRGRAAATGAGEEAATLLALMGRRGGWSVDALVEASGLRVGAVQHALICLELDGRVACDGFASYAPCA